MLTNLTILSLFLIQPSQHSPMFSQRAFSPSRLKIVDSYFHRFFNNLYFLEIVNSENSKNEVMFDHSTFSKFLRTTIKISNVIYDSKIFHGKRIHESNDVYINRCCFLECGDVTLDNGGAIEVDTFDYVINVAGTSFTLCRALYGGEISSTSTRTMIENGEFVRCTVKNSGSCLYICKGSISPISTARDFTMSRISCLFCPEKNSNPSEKYLFWVEDNKLNVHQINQTGSVMKREGGFRVCPVAQQPSFQYLNIMNNTAQNFLTFNLEYSDLYLNVNLVKNTITNNADKYLINILSLKTAKTLNLQYFCVVGNTPADFILAKDEPNAQISFVSCYFDFPDSEKDNKRGKYNLNACYYSSTQTIDKKFNIDAYTCPNNYSVSQQPPKATISPTPSLSVNIPIVTSSDESLTPEITSSTSSLIQKKTNSFTASHSFTPSNIFTPNKTRVPNPIQKADIIGNENPFSAEEFKKAAASMTFSFAFIIAAIVLTIYYIRKKVKQINPEINANELDLYSSDSVSDPYSSSFSYYTYSYYSSSEYSDFHSLPVTSDDDERFNLEKIAHDIVLELNDPNQNVK
ncbi:hypothetical protein TRFO_26071 [Tritrichomonas foetus]|uniref:Right handed beta helix domain-containing protein n=1 Tax=Tritrichomonas foetus TaxID=1144522 RepID=A0A1J4K3I1_9EUKA|nr:hypothetical protein TRFO_26071 [Tritrichomonas foetus]|eukprot:OHT06001.1 hypothetical protein TRFO_26071 [Tritrichomonas foetus]